MPVSSSLRLTPNIQVSLLRRTRRQTPTVWVSRLSQALDVLQVEKPPVACAQI